MSKKILVHPQAINESPHVGAGTRIWAFAHLLPGAKVGRDCNICDHVFIENDVMLGDRVTVKCGVQLWDGLRIGDRVFIGPNATFTNDPFPRSRRHLAKHPQTILETGCSIGANATVLPGLTIGRDAMVGAGSVVTQSVPAFAIVMGNPARITGYAGTSARLPRHSPAPAAPASQKPPVEATAVRGVTLRRLSRHTDMRGDLYVGEHGPKQTVPFAVKRHFLVFNVPSPEVRGQHAHRRCHQMLFCLQGSCAVVADDGRHRAEFILDDRQIGLHLPPLTWALQYRYTSDAVALVLASHPYDAGDYVRDYDAFLRLVSGRHRAIRPQHSR